jgi:hypothetical protein
MSAKQMLWGGLLHRLEANHTGADVRRERQQSPQGGRTRIAERTAVAHLVGRMSPILADTVMVREQLGFTLNRLGWRDEAERTLRSTERAVGRTGCSDASTRIAGRRS